MFSPQEIVELYPYPNTAWKMCQFFQLPFTIRRVHIGWGVMLKFWDLRLRWLKYRGWHIICVVEEYPGSYLNDLGVWMYKPCKRKDKR